MSGETASAEFLGPGLDWQVYATAGAAAGDLKRGGKYPRAVVLFSGGTLEVTKVDNVAATIPDPGGYAVVPLGFRSVTGGTATNFALVW